MGADHTSRNSCSQTGRHNNFTTFCPGKMIPGPFFVCLVFQSFHHRRGSPKNIFPELSLGMVLENFESPLDSKEIKPVNLKGNQPWIFIGRTEAEAPILWPNNAESQLTGKVCDAGKNWGQEEKQTTEDERVEWPHQLNGHEFEQTLGDSEGQGSLVCCNPWGRKESDMTEQLNNGNLNNTQRWSSVDSPRFYHEPKCIQSYDL